MKRIRIVACTVAAFGVVASARAQAPIPVRQIVIAAASDSGAFAQVAGVRHLADGRVLVNDAARLRLVVLDSTLKRSTIVFDTTERAPNKYGGSAGVILAYLGDSTVFVDRSALAMLVLDEKLRVARVMAPPKAGDLVWLATNTNMVNAFDTQGRLIYRGGSTRALNFQLAGRDTIAVRVERDSEPIVRADPVTRTFDTLGYVARAPVKTVYRRTATGSTARENLYNPVGSTDDWTPLADGTIAIVRAHDYHIDWINPSGVKTSTPKMPFDWRRITDEEKLQMLDAARKAHDQSNEGVIAAAAARGTPPNVRPFRGVDPADMPDYVPPIRAGAVRADPDGNVWILPTTSSIASSGVVYDVVNRKGEIVERVEIPRGRLVIGFGARGVLYLLDRRTSANLRLERARVIR